jgi:hypothetical protein
VRHEDLQEAIAPTSAEGRRLGGQVGDEGGAGGDLEGAHVHAASMPDTGAGDGGPPRDGGLGQDGLRAYGAGCGAARRSDTNETARIKTNPYPKGVILNAIEFEGREGLPGVVAWVRNGTDAALPAATGMASSVAPPAAPETLGELRPPPPPATKLELRSLLRTAKRTVAVINGERFVPGSELSMLINGKRQLVRLEATHENTVIVSVDGEKQTLRLGAK